MLLFVLLSLTKFNWQIFHYKLATLNSTSYCLTKTNAVTLYLTQQNAVLSKSSESVPQHLKADCRSFILSKLKQQLSNQERFFRLSKSLEQRPGARPQTGGHEELQLVPHTTMMIYNAVIMQLQLIIQWTRPRREDIPVSDFWGSGLKGYWVKTLPFVSRERYVRMDPNKSTKWAEKCKHVNVCNECYILNACRSSP